VDKFFTYKNTTNYNDRMNKSLLVAKLNAISKSLPEITLMYIFGSQVNGDTGPLSDVDLGVLIDPNVEDNELFVRLTLILTETFPDIRFDLVPLHLSPVELAYQIIAHGVCIYEQDTLTRVEFEADILGQHGDYIPVLREHYRDILRGDDYDRRVQRYRKAIRRTERTLNKIKTTGK
jgi:uncharacterized protein